MKFRAPPPFALATSYPKRKEDFAAENIYLSSHKRHSVGDKQTFF